MPTYSAPEAADNPLLRLLLLAVPKNQHGNKTILHLADLLGVNKWSVWKWVRAQKIPPERALAIVELSEGRVKIEDFHPFVYKT